MPRSNRPHEVLASSGRTLLPFFFPECKVKTATPMVTAATTRYLYKGYRRRKTVMWRNITGSNLQLFARRNVI
jgi:hypothetical protein